MSAGFYKSADFLLSVFWIKQEAATFAVDGKKKHIFVAAAARNLSGIK